MNPAKLVITAVALGLFATSAWAADGEGKLFPDDGEEGHYFGFSTAVSG